MSLMSHLRLFGDAARTATLRPSNRGKNKTSSNKRRSSLQYEQTETKNRTRTIQKSNHCLIYIINYKLIDYKFRQLDQI